MLWLVESEYPPFERDDDVKGMAMFLWAQYVLDSFATVAEAVSALYMPPSLSMPSPGPTIPGCRGQRP